jgi:Ca2+-binding EF-hand superfamily protein
MRTLSLAILVTSVALAGGAARAQSHAAASEDPRAAFAEADRNKDGNIDREEFHERLVDVFYTADVNKDGSLSVEEFATLDTRTNFGEMDKNENGSVSMTEFIAFRFRQFDEADADHDGLLSVEEVVAFVNR